MTLWIRQAAPLTPTQDGSVWSGTWHRPGRIGMNSDPQSRSQHGSPSDFRRVCEHRWLWRLTTVDYQAGTTVIAQATLTPG
jgi:hypothetical protein